MREFTPKICNQSNRLTGVPLSSAKVIGTGAQDSSLLSVHREHGSYFRSPFSKYYPKYSSNNIPGLTRSYLWRDVCPGCCMDRLVQEIQNNECLIVADVGSKVSQDTARSGKNERDSHLGKCRTLPALSWLFSLFKSRPVLIKTISHSRLNGFF